MRVLVMVKMDALPHGGGPAVPVEPFAVQDEAMNEVPRCRVDRDDGGDGDECMQSACPEMDGQHSGDEDQCKIEHDTRVGEVSYPELRQGHLAQIKATARA